MEVHKLKMLNSSLILKFSFKIHRIKYSEKGYKNENGEKVRSFKEFMVNPPQTNS